MPNERNTTEYIVSKLNREGVIIESIQDDDGAILLAKYDDTNLSYSSGIELVDGTVWLPIPAQNNLIKHSVVLLPPKAIDYGTYETLVDEIRTFINSYVTLSTTFLEIAVYYVLLSWVYDAFREVPYLRFRGDFGSGKTRAIQVIGHLLYKPVFASGAATTSPLFHSLDMFRGSLILDEADFRSSDEKSELTKILNNGTVAGFPVLRSVPNDKKIYDPRAFAVFGPKVVSMREFYKDAALESRFLTETMGYRKPACHIPLSLPVIFYEDARNLRGKLLSWRFKHVLDLSFDEGCYSPKLSSRSNQIIAPLLACVRDQAVRDRIIEYVHASEQERKSDRSIQIESLVLSSIIALSVDGSTSISIGDIRTYALLHFGDEFERTLTARYLGYIIRAKLSLKTVRVAGVYHILIDRAYLETLAIRFGQDFRTSGL